MPKFFMYLAFQLPTESFTLPKGVFYVPILALKMPQFVDEIDPCAALEPFKKLQTNLDFIPYLKKTFIDILQVIKVTTCIKVNHVVKMDQIFFINHSF